MTEYKGATVTACEDVWLKRILKDLGVPITDLILLYCNNMSNIHMARNPVFHVRTKHIKAHYHVVMKKTVPRRNRCIARRNRLFACARPLVYRIEK